MAGRYFLDDIPGESEDEEHEDQQEQNRQEDENSFIDDNSEEHTGDEGMRPVEHEVPSQNMIADRGRHRSRGVDRTRDSGRGRGRGRVASLPGATTAPGRGRGIHRRGSGVPRTLRARAWAFTINNYTSVPTVLQQGMRYLVVGEEVSPSGTPHLQGYVVFNNPVQNPHRYFLQHGPQGHFEVAQGSPDQNIEYCKKEDNFHEFVGEAGRPQDRADQGHHGRGQGHHGRGQGHHGRVGRLLEKEEWQRSWDLAKEGKIEDISPRKRIRHLSSFMKVQSMFPPKLEPIERLNNIWIKGPSGSGKSRWVDQTYPYCYRKLNNKWWQGYNMSNPEHKVVVCEDVHPDSWTDLPQLKIWADHYPFIAEVKGGSLMIRPEIIIVTSNYTPEQCFRREEDLEPIHRRFRIVVVTDLPPPPVREEQGARNAVTKDTSRTDDMSEWIREGQELQDIQDQVESGPSRRDGAEQEEFFSDNDESQQFRDADTTQQTGEEEEEEEERGETVEFAPEEEAEDIRRRIFLS